MSLLHVNTEKVGSKLLAGVIAKNIMELATILFG